MDKGFNSKIDLDKFIAYFGLGELHLPELYNTAMFISMYFGEGKNNKEIHSKKLLRFFNNKSLKWKEKTFKVFEWLDIDMKYRFDLTDKDNSYCRLYYLKKDFVENLLHNFLLDKPRKYFKKKVKKNGLTDGVKIYKNKKVAKELGLSGENISKLNKQKYFTLYSEAVKSEVINIDEINDDIEINDRYLLTKEDYCFHYDLECDTLNLKGIEDEYARYLELEKTRKLTREEQAIAGRLLFIKHGVKKGILNMGYLRKDFGRLFALDIYPTINLQSLPKRQRKILFKDYYEYDMNTAVASVLMGLSDEYDNPTSYPYIEAYIGDKDFFRQKIVDMGFTYKEAKQYFTSLFFGANVLDTHYKSNLRKVFKKEELEYILEDDSVCALVNECMDLFTYLKNYYKRISKVGKMFIITNKVNKKLSFSTWKSNESKVLPFIYQGIEAYILDELKNHLRTDMLLFDSFISKEDYSVNELEAITEELLGFGIKWSKEKY